jgi:hypothetical protein
VASNPPWYHDTGSTHHLTNDLSNLYHAPVLGYKGNANLNLKIYLHKSTALLDIDINHQFHYIYIYIQCHKFQKEDILYNTKVMSVPNDLMLLARSMPLPKNEFGLLRPKKVGGRWVSSTTQ